MRPDIIIMLTHHDVTVKNAAEVFEECKDLEEVKYWGFKNVGLPKDQMKALVAAMKAAGKTTFLEVVTYDEASCLDGAQTAIDCGFDYLMGTLYYDSVAKLLKDNGMEYLPFVGKVSGSPSILEGTNEEIIENAKELMAKGIQGFDILAYRHVIDGEKLAYEFCAAVPTARSSRTSSARPSPPRSASPAASTASSASTPCSTSGPGPSRWAPPCSRRSSSRPAASVTTWSPSPTT